MTPVPASFFVTEVVIRFRNADFVPIPLMSPVVPPASSRGVGHLSAVCSFEAAGVHLD